jgi:hypothetical protein
MADSSGGSTLRTCDVRPSERESHPLLQIVTGVNPAVPFNTLSSCRSASRVPDCRRSRHGEQFVKVRAPAGQSTSGDAVRDVLSPRSATSARSSPAQTAFDPSQWDRIGLATRVKEVTHADKASTYPGSRRSRRPLCSTNMRSSTSNGAIAPASEITSTRQARRRLAAISPGRAAQYLKLVSSCVGSLSVVTVSRLSDDRDVGPDEGTIGNTSRRTSGIRDR